MAAESERMRTQLRTAAHDLRNLAYRLSVLTDNLRKEMPSSAARADAGDLLSDTSSRLEGMADLLKKLSAAED
jgi:hypothetical protein